MVARGTREGGLPREGGGHFWKVEAVPRGLGAETLGWGDQERMAPPGIGSWEALGDLRQRSWSGEGFGGTTGWEPYPALPCRRPGKGKAGKGEVGRQGPVGTCSLESDI